MQEFLRKHEGRIHSVLSCFDRMLFRGYLPMMSGLAMAQFLKLLELDGSTVKLLLLKNSERVKEKWLKMYDKAGLVLRVESVINVVQQCILHDPRMKAMKNTASR